MKTTFALLFTALLALSPAAHAEHDGGDGHACHRPDKMQKADANQDGSIDKTEAQAMHDRHFIEMDKDGDGKLSKDEMAACQQKDHKHE